MPWTKSGVCPGQDFQRSGANPTIFYFFQTWSGAGQGQVASGLGQVRSKFLVVEGKFSSRYQAWFYVKFSKIGKNGLAIDGRGIVVKLSGSLATPKSMASLPKNFQFSEPNLPLTFPVRQTFSISGRPLMHWMHDVWPRLIITGNLTAMLRLYFQLLSIALLTS